MAYCKECGNKISDSAVICMKCGVATNNNNKNRIVYILLALFLGFLGIHNFYAGYIGRGMSQLLITLFLGFLIIPLIAVFIWILIEICVITQDAQGKQFS